MRLPVIGDVLVSSVNGPFTVTETVRHRGWLLVRLHSEIWPAKHLVATLHPEVNKEAAARFTDSPYSVSFVDEEGGIWWSCNLKGHRGSHEDCWEKQQEDVSFSIDQREQELRQLEMAAHGQ